MRALNLSGCACGYVVYFKLRYMSPNLTAWCIQINKHMCICCSQSRYCMTGYPGHVSDEIPNLTWCKDGEGEEEREGERVHCWC